MVVPSRPLLFQQKIEKPGRCSGEAWCDVLVKVILETATLNEDPARIGCGAAEAAGADFVTTSTSLHPKGGASAQAVNWLVNYSPGLGVKASGGIRDCAAAQAMIAAGVCRLGTSSGIAIMRGHASVLS